jgi:uncharacterized surface protein with fasciclin (FAS1) repeats
MKVITSIAAVVFCLFLASCNYHGNSKQQTIAQLAVANPDLSTLVTALKKADLVDTLNSKGPFTVFAPTNSAFNKIPDAKLQALLNNPKKLKQVLLYHVVSGKVTSDMIKPGHVKTVQGKSVNIRVSHGNVYVNRAKVVKADVMASNGVIHVINTVLIPR